MTARHDAELHRKLRDHADALFRAGDPDEAMSILNGVLNENPDDWKALFMVGEIHLKASHFGMALNIYKRLGELSDHAGVIGNLGHAYHSLQRFPEAIDCFVRELKLHGYRYPPISYLVLANQVMGRPEEAIKLAKLAKFLCDDDTEMRQLYANVSMSYLSLSRWREGWRGYDYLLCEGEQRRMLKYGDAREWDGKPVNGQIVVYGEQGIGEAVLFASMIPDLIAAGHDIVIDCEPRLVSLFRRSFGVPCYGTQLYKSKIEKEWTSHHNIKAKIAIGSLGQLFRNADSDFPRVPYLRPDPVRRAMCRGLLDQWPGRKIGLAWSAGKKNTRSDDRSLSMADLEPLLRLHGITWVSLEYQGDAPADSRIKHVPTITQSKDYDDTAALVAELDSVVCPTTAVAFLAGALGATCHVAVPEHPTWHWGRSERFPWFDIALYRRVGGGWRPVVQNIQSTLCMPQLMEAAQ